MNRTEMSSELSHLPPPKTGRQLSGILTLRDVADVEDYVAGQLQDLGVGHADEGYQDLVLAGVETAYRIERALPPEIPLRPVLDPLLGRRLAARRVPLAAVA
jgi:hypothetical protein